MAQRTGNITEIQPLGGYQSQGGYIYTFQMRVQCPDGEVVGEIGSKSQVYPLSVGQQIIVNVTQTQHGIKLKKINPDQAQQGQQYSQPAPQQGQQNAPQPAGQQKPDWDAISRGKVRNAVVTAYIATGNDPIISDCDYWVEYIMTGQAPLPPAQQINQDDVPF